MAPVGRSEDLARYLFSGDYVTNPRSAVKPRAFMPEPRSSPPARSVFRTSSLDEAGIWALGKQQVEALRPGRTMKGWASLPVAQVEDARCPGDTGITLRVEPETSRHQLHADIVGWPQSEEDRLYLATLLAEASVLKLHA